MGRKLEFILFIVAFTIIGNVIIHYLNKWADTPSRVLQPPQNKK